MPTGDDINIKIDNSMLYRTQYNSNVVINMHRRVRFNRTPSPMKISRKCITPWWHV